jgi:hypothetical protein
MYQLYCGKSPLLGVDVPVIIKNVVLSRSSSERACSVGKSALYPGTSRKTAVCTHTTAVCTYTWAMAGARYLGLGIHSATIRYLGLGTAVPLGT